MPHKGQLILKFSICTVLTALVLIVYFQTRGFDYVGLDDPDYVTKNPVIKAGLTAGGIRWSFENSFSSNWHPLTWISHMADCQIFGINAGPQHLVNVAFHIVNTCLLFLWLFYVTGFIWKSAFVASLFALHPLHVESVAWISERKDVLSAFFFILTLWSYCAYVKSALNHSQKKKTTSLYAIALFVFVLGLMSKPMLVTVPFVLLLLDFWPLKRLSTLPLTISLRDKLPFLLLALASSAVTLWAQGSGHSIASLDQFPVWNRIINALSSYSNYLLKTFWPINLAAFYPFPLDLDYFGAALAVLLFFGLCILGWTRRKSNPYIIVGSLWFFGMLLPVIGLIQVGGQAMADRYTYLPLIGIFILLTWLIDENFLFAFGRTLKVIGAAAAVVLCTIVSNDQVKTWRNTRSLFEHAAHNTKSNYLAWTALGNIFNGEGKQDEAYSCFSRAIEMRRNYPSSWFGLAVVLYGQGRKDDAFTCYKEAVRLNPDDPEMLDGYGVALFKSERLEEAERCFRKAIAIRPIYAEANLHLGMLLQKIGRTDEALHHYQESVRLEPNAADSRFNLGNAYLVGKELDEALKEYLLAVQLRPRFIEARIALGNLLLQKGMFDAAATNFSSVLTIAPTNSFALDGLGYTEAMSGRPDSAYPLFVKSVEQVTNNANAHLHLAMAFERRNEIEKALSHYHTALALDPTLVAALNNMAWLKATHSDPSVRSGSEAVELAQRACKLTNFTEPMFLGTLAAAYAESGQFAEAISTAEKARTLALSKGQKQVADKNTVLLELYRAGKAYHE
jgi:tetratricopeptide (TPR) repeat protein